MLNRILETNEKLFDIYFHKINSYRYVSPMIKKDGAFCNKYHILINNNEEPIRMYFTDLNRLIDLNIRTFRDAQIYRLEYLKALVNDYEIEIRDE